MGLWIWIKNEIRWFTQRKKWTIYQTEFRGIEADCGIGLKKFRQTWMHEDGTIRVQDVIG